MFDGLSQAGQARNCWQLRKLILDTAKTTKGVGAIEEALKWGQPSYLTSESKSGSTIRIDQVKAVPGQYAVYFHCQTNLVETFRELYPDLKYSGNRAILLDAQGQAARSGAAPLRGAGADVSSANEVARIAALRSAATSSRHGARCFAARNDDASRHHRDPQILFGIRVALRLQQRDDLVMRAAHG